MKKEIKWLENVKENKLDSVWYGGRCEIKN